MSEQPNYGFFILNRMAVGGKGPVSKVWILILLFMAQALIFNRLEVVLRCGKNYPSWHSIGMGTKVVNFSVYQGWVAII